MKTADPICDISYDSDGDQLLCVTENRKISFLSLHDGQTTLLLSCDYLGNSVSFSRFKSSKSLAAVACSDNSILLIDLNTGKTLNKYTGHAQKILGLEFAKDKNLLISCGDDGIFILWELKEPCIPRSFSEGMLNVDLPRECVPAWARKHSKSEVPVLNRNMIPQGRWAQRIPSEGILLHSDADPASKPVATYHKRTNKRLSAEVESREVDRITTERDQLQFDIVQRDKWDFSKVKLINQSQMSPPDSPDTLLPNTTLNSLDLAGPAPNVAMKTKSSDMEDSGRIRSKSDFLDMKDTQVEAVGIVLKKGHIDAAINSSSFNIGEVEDDDENQSTSIEKPIEVFNKVEDQVLQERKRERHSTLGFVEAMVQKLEILKSSDDQNTDKISDIENELSKIGDLVKDALGR
jgi:WD40 repeat protein